MTADEMEGEAGIARGVPHGEAIDEDCADDGEMEARVELNVLFAGRPGGEVWGRFEFAGDKCEFGGENAGDEATEAALEGPDRFVSGAGEVGCGLFGLIDPVDEGGVVGREPLGKIQDSGFGALATDIEAAAVCRGRDVRAGTTDRDEAAGARLSGARVGRKRLLGCVERAGSNS